MLPQCGLHLVIKESEETLHGHVALLRTVHLLGHDQLELSDSIDSNVADNEISIDGYNIVKKNRHRHGGRVLLYVEDGIDYSEITELASEQVESVWIKLMYKKETLMLGVVYRPPSSNNDYFNCVLNQIDHVHSINQTLH